MKRRNFVKNIGITTILFPIISKLPETDDIEFKLVDEISSPFGDISRYEIVHNGIDKGLCWEYHRESYIHGVLYDPYFKNTDNYHMSYYNWKNAPMLTSHRNLTPQKLIFVPQKFKEYTIYRSTVHEYSTLYDFKMWVKEHII